MKEKQNYRELKPEKLQEVIALLDKVIPLATRVDHFDMKESKVYQKDPFGYHQCGTIHCFAGWLANASFIKNGKIKHPTNETIRYGYGIRVLDDIFGFQLDTWAKANPILWNNEFGDCIFTDELAFMDKPAFSKPKRPFGAKRLSHTRDHLVEVKNRIIKLNQEV